MRLLLLLRRWRDARGCGRSRGREGKLAVRFRSGCIGRIEMATQTRFGMVLLTLMMMLLRLVLLLVVLLLLLLLLARAGRRIVQAVLRKRILQPRHAERARGAVPLPIATAAFEVALAFALTLAVAVVHGGAGGNGCARAFTTAAGILLLARVGE